jgi:hypothetical protein
MKGSSFDREVAKNKSSIDLNSVVLKDTDF